MIWTSLRKYKRIIVLYLVIIILGIISGIIYCKKAQIDIYPLLIDQINKNCPLLFNSYHIIFIFLTIILTFIYIGPLLNLFNMFIEGFCLGIFTATLFIKKRINGFIFGIIVYILGKGIYLMTIILLGIITIKFILSKKDSSKFNNYLKSSFIIIFIVFFNEYIIRIFANKLCLYFSFLIK